MHLRDENGESNNSAGVQMNAHWYFHSTKDLCFTFVNPVFEMVKQAYGKDVFFMANDESIMATKEKLKDLSALEELVMVGYPIGLSDTRNNYPIFRKGYTSLPIQLWILMMTERSGRHGVFPRIVRITNFYF